MNKKILLLLVNLILLIFSVYAETILVAPVIVYDNENNSVELNENPAKNIFDNLSQYWFEGLITFRRLSEKEYGQVYTIIDANHCCLAENADYILFGYIQKNENNWFANIKLYEQKNKKIRKEFFSGDDIFHYERFIDDLCSNVLNGLEEVTNIKLDKILEEETRPFEIKLPISVFYWSPIDKNWAPKMLGIVGANIGTEIFPPQPKTTIGSFLIDYSLMPEISYSYAMGKDDVYPLNYNAISLVLPACIHIYFDTRNTLYFGFGPYYEIELLNVQQKYKDTEFHYQNMFGVESIIGYEFNANELINLFAEVRFDFHFKQDKFLSIKPGLGMSFNLYRGQ